MCVFHIKTAPHLLACGQLCSPWCLRVGVSHIITCQYLPAWVIHAVRGFGCCFCDGWALVCPAVIVAIMSAAAIRVFMWFSPLRLGNRALLPKRQRGLVI